MSYTEEEKKQANDEILRTAQKQGLKIKMVNLDETYTINNLFWYIMLVSVGACCVALCIVIYGM